MAIPAGVTIRKIGDPRSAITKPRNLIERAAMCPDVEMAKGLICEGLGLDPESPLAAIHLSWAARWKAFSEPSRLMEIGNWLKAEAYECMDLVQGSAVSTKGD